MIPTAVLSIVIVSASWCGPCKQLHAELDAHGGALKDAGVDYQILTDDKAAERLYHVRVYPTIVLLKDGKEIARREGYATAADLAAWAGGFR